MMPNGYRMELVASDPAIISPVALEFDGNGRMYVAEMVGYMMDASATHEHDPVSRISRWESTKGDGHFDKHTIFVDHIVAPRMVLALQDGVILTSETDSDDIVKWTDTNGDGVADKREVVFTGIGQSGDANIEHQKAGLVWNMDNWIYTTYNPFRIRWTPTGFLREPTGANGGQWGLATDDDGKPWFVDAGGERGPMNFQYPIEYGGFTPCAGAGRGGRGAFGAAAAPVVAPTDPAAAAQQAARVQAGMAPDPNAPPPPPPDPNCPAGMEGGFEPDFAVVWPAPGIQDMQGGMGRIRMPAGNLNHFTAATGPAIVRGDRVPADLKGDFLFTEPVGRLVRRARIEKIEGLTELHNAYPGSEFITSQDQLFRPVNIHNAPDGTVYIADMYHGIIQEFQWSGPGSYLRAKIEQYQLDKVAQYGRIWRLRYDGRAAVPQTTTNQGQAAIPAIQLDLTQPRMYSETPAQIVAHLSHPNGWWRDMAQRQLILKQDKSVAPALQQLVRTSPDLTTRFNALWTLEGLGALDVTLVRQQMEDPNPRMRVQAIRASETLYKAGDKSLEADYRHATQDPDADVAIQGMLTLSVFKVADLAQVVKTAQASNKARGVKIIGDHLVTPGGGNNAFGGGRGGGALTPEQQNLMQHGNEVFTQVCFACHGSDGRGQPMAGAAPGTTMAPPLAGSPRVTGHRDYVIKVLLNGLTGPVSDKTYTEVMIPMGNNNDDWIASAASYIRNSFGNAGGVVTAAEVARVRASVGNRKTQWTVAELEASLPHLLDPQPAWKISASHNADAAAGALTLRAWNSQAAQTPGMWFQVELPQPAMITEIQFDSTGGGRGGGGGAAGGRGGAGRAGAAGAAGTGAPQNAAVGTPAAPAVPAPGAAAGPAAPGAPGGLGGFGAQAPAAPTYPRGYRVQVSMDGTNWGKPLAEGQGSGGRNVISFAPTRGKFVRITETGTADDNANWSMSGLRIYEAPAAPGK
jgi:mono/diheme cytochrome c family protein